MIDSAGPKLRPRSPDGVMPPAEKRARVGREERGRGLLVDNDQERDSDRVTLELDTADFRVPRSLARKMTTILHALECHPGADVVPVDQDAGIFRLVLNALRRDYRLDRGLSELELHQLKHMEKYLNCPALKAEIVTLYKLRQGVWRHKEAGGAPAAAAYRALAVGLMGEDLGAYALRKLTKAQKIYPDPKADTAIFLRGVERRPKDPLAWEALARGHEAAEEHSEQLDALEKACRLAPTPERWFSVGEAYLDRFEDPDDYEDAASGRDAFAAALDALASQSPRNRSLEAACYIRLGACLLRLWWAQDEDSENGEADAAANRAGMENLDEGERLAWALKDPRLMFKIAQERQWLSEHTDAEDMPAFGERRARAIVAWDRAIACGTASGLSPEEMFFYHAELGIMLAQESLDFQRSVQHYNAAILMSNRCEGGEKPENSQFHTWFAGACTIVFEDNQGDLVVAQQLAAALQSAVYLKPRSAKLRAQLASVLVHIDPERARDQLEAALDLGEDKLGVKLAKNLLHTACVLSADEEEEIILRRLLTLEDTSTRCKLSLEACLARRGKVNEALALGRATLMSVRVSTLNWRNWLQVLVAKPIPREAAGLLGEVFCWMGGGTSHIGRSPSERQAILDAISIQDSLGIRRRLLRTAVHLDPECEAYRQAQDRLEAVALPWTS